MSKRKNTSLAFNGGGLNVYDPAMMLGSGSKDRWWKRQETSVIPSDHNLILELDADAAADGPSFLPSWLFGKPQAGKQDQGYVKDGSERLVSRERMTSEELVREFQRRLPHTLDLKSIQRTIRMMQLDLRQHPELSGYIFRLLLERYGRADRYDMLTKALCDPELNPPGSSNQLLLIRHICSSNITRRKWDTYVFPALLNAIQLGLVSVQDLQALILLIADVHRIMASSNHVQKVHAEWHRLLTAVEQSRILRLSDFDQEFMTKWYKEINDNHQADTTCILLWRLRGYSNLSELNLASNLTVRRLHDFAKVDSGSSEKLTNWFTGLPVELQGPAMIQATFEMLAAASNGNSMSQDALEKWSLILPLLRSDLLGEFLSKRTSWSEACVNSYNLSHAQQLLCVAWIVAQSWASSPGSVAQFADTKLRDEFERVFTETENAEQFDRIGQVVLTLDTLPLPEKDRIFPILRYFSQENLVQMLGHEEYLAGLKSCFRLEYARLADNSFFFRARKEFPQVIHSVADTINDDLPQFQAMAQTLILRKSENFRIVQRLLYNNVRLKFALSQSWPAVLAKRSNKEHNSDSDLDPMSVLNMIEKLTMTFAVSPAISPRCAFKNVRKMYLFLHKYGAPVRPTITRALWHAGVTRYGQSSAPKEQVTWCIARVREVEGKAVADRLLWSAGFRSSFVNEYMQTLTEGLPCLAIPASPSDRE